MSTSPAGDLLACLRQVPDPRGLQGRRHPLVAMLAATVCAVLSGARGCDAIAEWVKIRGLAVWHALGGTRHPPCSNCFRDLLAVLPPDVLERALQEWLGLVPATESTAETLPTEQELPTNPPVTPVRLDGKTLRGTLTAHAKAIHLLTAWDEEQGGILKQLACESVGQEAQVAVQMIRQLFLKGKVVTADAGFCHATVCQAIRDQQGDYLLTVKDNQPQLKAALELEFLASTEVFSPLRTTAT